MNWKTKYKLFSPSKRNTRIFIIFSFLAFALIVDALIGAVPDFLQDRIVSGSGIAFIYFVAACYVVGQYFILQFVKEKTIDIRV